MWDPRLELRAQAGSDGSIRISRTTGTNEATVLPGKGAPVEWLYGFSPEGRYLAATYQGKGTMLWDIETRQAVVDDIPGTLTTDFSADGQTFVASGRDGQLRRFGLNPIRPLPSLALESRYLLLRLRPQGGLFAGGESQKRNVELRDLGNGALLRTLTNPANVISLGLARRRQVFGGWLRRRSDCHLGCHERRKAE